MATLTETAYYTRKAINWGIIALVAIFIFRAVFGYALDYWRKLHPPPPPPPNVAFGKLPAIKFPPPAGGINPTAKLSFTLETIEGKPLVATSTAAVYFMPKPAPNLLSLARANQFAAKLNFRNEPRAETQTLYRWQDSQTPLRTLSFDIVTNNFKVGYDYATDLSVFTEKNLPSPSQAIAETKDFLQNLGLYSPSLENGSVETSFWKLVGNGLIPTTSLADADAVRVDLRRQGIEGMELRSPNYPQDLIYLLFSGSSDTNKKLLEVSYKFWQIETEQKATYPLKTAATAWEELKNGQGFIVKIRSGDKVTVRKIYLAYFYPEDYQEFLQPVFVFEGDPGFLAYVAAISPAWTVP